MEQDEPRYSLGFIRGLPVIRDRRDNTWTQTWFVPRAPGVNTKKTRETVEMLNERPIHARSHIWLPDGHFVGLDMEATA